MDKFSTLSIIDCGLGWRERRTETTVVITEKLSEVFWEIEPVGEVFMDNSTAFRSESFQEILRKWSISSFRPSGNGIELRISLLNKSHSRTRRDVISPIETVIWYKSPKSGHVKETVPQRSVFLE